MCRFHFFHGFLLMFRYDIVSGFLFSVSASPVLLFLGCCYVGFSGVALLFGVANVGFWSCLF